MSDQYKVLCIGVNKVPAIGLKELTYAEKNAAAVAAYFKTLKNNADIMLLTGKSATKPAIFNWINQNNALPGKLTVLLFFSGHGFEEEKKGREGMERCLWINSSERAGTDLESHKLKVSKILEALNNPLHRLILVIDACYNLDKKFPAASIFDRFENSERFTSLKSYAIISSAAVERRLFEDPALEHGVLTHYFLQILSGKHTFFLQKKIAFFKFLEILDKKVRDHRFVTQTGRKRSHPMQRKNGVMAHFSGKSFKLPVLEPIPLVLDPCKNGFLRKISQLFHFFTSTRLRIKILLMSRIMGILLLLIYLVHGSMVRIHFTPPDNAAFQDTLWANQRFSLYGLKGEMLGEKYFEEFSLYRFKHNWADALLRKLDEKGRIILLGNLFGKRLTGINETQIIEFALGNSNDIFYWHLADVMKLLGTIRKEYRNFDIKRKRMALELLAKLGKNGKVTALNIFNFRKETDQDLRNLFLKHFYSSDFLTKNINYLNPYDYLYFIKNKKQVPSSMDSQLRKKTAAYLRSIFKSIPDSYIEITDKLGEVHEKIKILTSFGSSSLLSLETQFRTKTEKFLRMVAESIPDSHIRITDKSKLSEIYEKLEILATFGSHYFRKKASDVFKKAFVPDKVMGLFWVCSNFPDKLWLLELYFRRVQQVKNRDWLWYKFVYNYIRHLPLKEKSRVLKTILDTNLELIPRQYRESILWALRDVDPQIVTLTDWENWIQRYRIALQYTAYPIIENDYENVFSLLENHYEYFRELLTGPNFNRLYEFNQTRTVNLAKRIFEINDEAGQLNAAVFLYNKNYLKYSTFIVEFLEKAKVDIHKQHLLKEFYGSINETVIQLISHDKDLKESFKPLLNQPKLFYRFFRTNILFWPEEVIKRILAAKIPKSYNEGRLLLRICERLPDVYRKKMLFKINKADLDVGFKWKAESSLAKHYPGEFLELVNDSSYRWGRYTDESVVEAYQAFSYEALKDELILNLREESYWKVGFICHALIGKKDEKLNIQDIQLILAEFERPLERILLRELRYNFHKSQYDTD